MQQIIVDREKLELTDDRKLLSPPWLIQPLYQCATALTVTGFVPHAEVDIEVSGATVVTQTVGWPDPQGATLALPAPLVVGQQVRARQRAGGLESEWSPIAVVRDHTADFPSGPPRPQISPTPLYDCGSRTGVDNLLGGGNVWVTADAAEVGRVNGCAAPRQGVSVNPDFGVSQHVRAWFELCGDPSPPSVEHITQPAPAPLPAPGFDAIFDGGDQLTITGVANGARVSLERSGNPVGTYRCWGGALKVGLSPPFSVGETFSATQQLCRSDPPSPPGGTVVQPCSALPAPVVGPVQAGDTVLSLVTWVAGAVVRVYRNGNQVGFGAPPTISLTTTLKVGDVVHVVQSVDNCVSRLAAEVIVSCIDPAFGPDPSALDLFPVGFTDYNNGPVRGNVYYPADDDGNGRPFNTRLAKLGRTPIVVMAHGNHSPADPSYLGYDYFQRSLAQKGIVAVSVDCNALNGAGGGVSNIEDRADLIIDSIKHFQGLDATAGSVFFGQLDFGRVGLMGHSRGGDAVVTIPDVIGNIGVTIRSVLALAPTNFRYWSGMSTIKPVGYTFMTILPASDGDVVDNNGAQFYDQAEPGPLKSQVYAHACNHNFFNRKWLGNDGVTPIHTRRHHERVLDVYGSALFRFSLLGHGLQSLLEWRSRPSGLDSTDIHLAFARANRLTVDNHDDGNTIATNSLSLPTSQSGGLSADEHSFDQVATAFNPSFFGLTVGMVATSKEQSGTFRSAIPVTNLDRSEVWIRVAEVAEKALLPDPVEFELGLEDASGVIGWVNAALVGGVPRPFVRPDINKTMLKTLRFKPACFREPGSRLNLREIQAILIRIPHRGRALAFDDLDIVRAR